MPRYGTLGLVQGINSGINQGLNIARFKQGQQQYQDQLERQRQLDQMRQEQFGMQKTQFGADQQWKGESRDRQRELWERDAKDYETKERGRAFFSMGNPQNPETFMQNPQVVEFLNQDPEFDNLFGPGRQLSGFVPLEKDEDGNQLYAARLRVQGEDGQEYEAPLTQNRTNDPNDEALVFTGQDLLNIAASRYGVTDPADLLQENRSRDRAQWDDKRAMIRAETDAERALGLYRDKREIDQDFERQKLAMQPAPDSAPQGIDKEDYAQFNDMIKGSFSSVLLENMPPEYRDTLAVTGKTPSFEDLIAYAPPETVADFQAANRYGEQLMSRGVPAKTAAEASMRYLDKLNVARGLSQLPPDNPQAVADVRETLSRMPEEERAEYLSMMPKEWQDAISGRGRKPIGMQSAHSANDSVVVPRNQPQEQRPQPSGVPQYQEPVVHRAGLPSLPWSTPDHDQQRELALQRDRDNRRRLGLQ